MVLEEIQERRKKLVASLDIIVEGAKQIHGIIAEIPLRKGRSYFYASLGSPEKNYVQEKPDILIAEYTLPDGEMYHIQIERIKK